VEKQVKQKPAGQANLISIALGNLNFWGLESVPVV
jgi:hypothetical protein